MQALPLIAVIRVISDNHKDEIGCMTLAPGTLHEEKSFFTVINIRDKGLRRENIERDLQTIHLLLNDRIWFGFDVKSAAKTLQHLYENINQPPPQSLALWEAFQTFESTFSWACESVAQAAQYLQILPWTKRNSNARIECDITFEVLSRIALSCAMRQWIMPTQSLTQEQINESQEMIPPTNEPIETQLHVHPETNVMVDENGTVPMIAQEELNHKSGHNNNETNIIQPIVEETIANTQQEIIPKEFSENSAIQQQYVDTEQTSATLHPNQKVTTYNVNSGAMNREEQMSKVDEEQDVSMRQDVDHKSLEMKSVGVENPQAGDGTQTAHVGGGQASWKDLAKGKQAMIPPSRPSQLHVVPGIRNKRNEEQGGKFKPFQQTRDPSTIKQHIGNAVGTKRVIWISYDGGREPLAPRGVQPTKWEGNDAFWGIPYHSRTGNETKFFLRNVKEVRDKHWLRSEDVNSNRFGNKKKNAQGNLSNNGIKTDAIDQGTNDNQTTGNVRTRPKQWQQQQRDNKKSTNPVNTAQGKSTGHQHSK